MITPLDEVLLPSLIERSLSPWKLDRCANIRESTTDAITTWTWKNFGPPLGQSRTNQVSNKQEDAFSQRPSIRFAIPDNLKNLLVDDWENITKTGLLVPLPSKAPANFIVDAYFQEEKQHRSLGPECEILEEFCSGMKVYFERALAKILLYRAERAQLSEVRKWWESGQNKDWEGRGVGDCYGGEHLARLLGKSPLNSCA